MGSHVALVKGNLHMGFQVDRATTFFDFDKGGCQMGSQVNEKKKRDKKKERKTRKRNNNKKKVRSLNEWILSKLGR